MTLKELTLIMGKSFMDQEVGFTLWSKEVAQKSVEDIMRTCAQAILSALGEIYAIEPLEWKEKGKYLIVANSYEVLKRNDGRYFWTYEGVSECCDSYEDGKALAEKHYKAMLLKCLTETLTDDDN